MGNELRNTPSGWWVRGSGVFSPVASGPTFTAATPKDAWMAAQIIDMLEADVEAENATLRERAALMEKALGLWMVEAEIGYRRHGVGVGSVLLRKYPADEAKFWTRTALAATSPAVEVVAPEGGGT